MLYKKVLTPKQVQKLLYYTYSMYLIKYNKSYKEGEMNKLFEDTIEAWEHGSVIRNVYDYIKKVDFSNELVACKEKVTLCDRKTENFIDKVLAVYGNYSGYELEQMTHNESPWQESMSIGKNTRISDKTIYNFYSKKYNIIKNLDNI